jgi:hypothetical protein
MALLQQIIEEGRRFAGAIELQVSDMSSEAPVGTTLAILERQLKSMSAVQARIHYAMKQEFKLLKEIIRDYTPHEYEYDPVEGGRKAKQADYDLVDVIPVSDPNASTMAQKVVQYQAAFQLAQSAPQLYDLPQLHRQMLDVLGIKNYQKLVPIAEDMKPRDPVTENMNILSGKPVKAFLYQDHRAHIAVHMAGMQDPHVQQLVGQNPQAAQMLQASMSAHIGEHLGMEYRKEIEQLMGRALPPYDEHQDEPEMPPEIEVQVSQLAAQAAQKLLQQHQQESQQQQNQQQAQDPLIQLQQQELQIKQGELQRKAQKDAADTQAKMAQIQVELKRIEANQETEGAKIAMQHANNDAQRRAQHEQQGFTSGIDMIKAQQQLNHQRQQQDKQLRNQQQKPPVKKGE